MAEELGINQLANIAFHLAAPYEIDEAYPRFAWYGFTGTPSVMFDGISRKVGGWEGIYDVYFGIIQNLLLDPAEIDLQFTGTLWDSTFDFSLTATVDEELPGDDPTLFFVITEDSLFHSGRIHNFTARMMSDEYGLPLKYPGDDISVNNSEVARSAWDMRRLRLLAVIQNYGLPQPKVYNAVVLDVPDLFWSGTRLTAPVDPQEEKVLPAVLHNRGIVSASYVLKPDHDLPTSWDVFLRIDGADYPDSTLVELQAGETKEVGIGISADSIDEGELVLDIRYEDRRSNARKVTFTCRAGALDLVLDHFAVDDDEEGGSSGDGDGIAEPTEIIELSTFLENTGDLTAYGVTSTLSSESPYLMILGAQESFGDVAPGDTVEGTPARIFVQPDCPTTDIWIREDIEDDEGNAWVDSFQIHVEAPTAVYLSDLSAEGAAGGIRLAWRVTEPALWTGCNVYRAVSPEPLLPDETAPAAWTRLNRFPIPVGPESAMSYLDRKAPPGEKVIYRLGLLSGSGEELDAGAVGCRYSIVPEGMLRVHQNVPNPFNPLTRIAYDVGTDVDSGGGLTRTTVKIYDTKGNLVITLLDGFRAQGRYVERWDGRNPSGVQVPSGIYFCRVSAGASSRTIRMVLLR